MTSISKNVYIDKLDDIVNKYNNTYHITIKMKPVDVKTSICIDFNKNNNIKIIVQKFLEHFMKKSCKKQIKKGLELKK